MSKKYVLKLTAEERAELQRVVRKGRVAGWKVQRAQVLLQCDQGADGPAWIDARIAEAYGVTTRSLESWRKQAVECGPLSLLERKARATPAVTPTLEGEKQARLTALACSKAPDGHARWSLRLLAERLVELEVVDTISHETVRRALKKNALKPWLKQMWCIPPAQDAAFVCQMEQVLEVYKRPYDSGRPVVCMDEQPKQLISETRVPLPSTPGRPERVDYEYVREGVCVVWMFVEPLAGWRDVRVTGTKTAVDWAHQVRRLVDDPRYAAAERITLVSDNLNTHSLASLYQAFAPAEALRLARKLELVHTPKHGSWLNVAEPELSVLTRQCLDRRIAAQQQVTEEAGAWSRRRNARQVGIDWQFTTENARIKLKHLYPKVRE